MIFKYRFIIWIKGVNVPVFVSCLYKDFDVVDNFAFDKLMSYVNCDDFKDYSYEIVEVCSQ